MSVAEPDRSPSSTPAAACDPAGMLAERMARYGFDPVCEVSGDEVDLVLRACPFETTALADPDTVCGLHLGLAHGLAESIGGIVVDDLVRRDPRQAHCSTALPHRAESRPIVMTAAQIA